MKRILCLLYLLVALPLHAEEISPSSEPQTASSTADAPEIRPHWIKTREKCRMQIFDFASTARFRWSGRCKGGLAEGPGTLSTYFNGKLSDKSRMTFRHGVPEGMISTELYHDPMTARIELEIRDGKPVGKMVRYSRDGGILTMFIENGRPTHHLEFILKDGSHFDGLVQADSTANGVWTYPDGGRYEGEMLFTWKHGKGKLTPKDGPMQEGEFILDEFVGISDERARKQMPAKFGLEFGMTRAQVEKLTGPLQVSESSQLRNAFDANHFPDEKLGTPDMILGKRSVYFDDEGKLWRVWGEILLKPDTYFGGGEVMQAYGSIRRGLTLNFQKGEQLETAPRMGEGLEACAHSMEWEKDNPDSFKMANEAAPLMAPSQRVIFDIGCGAMEPWRSKYYNEAGEEFSVSIRYGNLYATPLIYTASVANEDAMFEKMRKQTEAPAP